MTEWSAKKTIVLGEKNMKPIKSEEDRQERISQVKRQLGSPKLSPMKRRDLSKYLKKLMYAEVTDDGKDRVS